MLHDTDYNDESSENTPPTVPVKIGGVGDKRAAKARTDARENKEVSDGSSLAALQRGWKQCVTKKIERTPTTASRRGK
ncbi:hypothetical protein AK812_SmicGene7922 [Symbiodinium microadriaticum]|uniref:Uncharacterized protein n=1 Tax=Symbiodinium microadriaticum TaxID=2951 RepID=A0A1Q9EMI7_SYMMI|nr:hypothetical protein AK812_SmicGene7922 [Symbiodinium microadriaticum]